MDPEEEDLLRESGPAPKRGLLSPDQRKRLIFIGVAVLGGALIVKYFGSRIGAPASAIDTSALTTPASTDSTNNTYNVYPSNPAPAGTGGQGSGSGWIPVGLSGDKRYPVLPPTNKKPPYWIGPPQKLGATTSIAESAHKPPALIPPHLW